MPIVEILGKNQKAKFPDDMSKESIRDFLREKYKQELMQFNEPDLSPYQEIKPYKPSLRERMASGIAEGLQKTGLISNNYRAQRTGENLSALAEFLPVVGDVSDADEFGRAASSGDLAGMAMAGLGVVPVVGEAAKGAARGFTRGWYHGSPSKEQINKLISGKDRGWRGNGNAYGDGIYVTKTAATANEFAKDGQVLPLAIRGELFEPSSEKLSDADAALLDKWAESLNESDAARLSLDIGNNRKTVLMPMDEAKDFYKTQKANWEYFGGLNRTKPSVNKEGDMFRVDYTDFNSAPTFKDKTKNEAINALLHISGKSVGDAISAIGYDGIKYAPDEAVIFNSNNVRSIFDK